MDTAKEDCKLALACLDLTSLNDGDTEDTIASLCSRAKAEPRTAAVCVEGRFVTLAKELLKDTGVRIATVVNFPYGIASQDQVSWEIRNAIQDGADEVDLVWHYHAFLDGDEKEAVDPVRAAIAELERVDSGGKVGLKIILETGALEVHGSDTVRRAASLCLAVPGSQRITFLKTSTGKLASGAGASCDAVEALCNAIKDAGRQDSVGVKVSGGVRTASDARKYLDLVRHHMGKGWITPERFRFGASGLWNALVEELGVSTEVVAASAPASY
ncbi:deoxyribose-phosphate aldolase [Hyaloraphidium curvatum]|nr:deoxyribose-phosphate aldolase [Hyaloraphidium curvatum]